jgi:hypothetical protein
MIGVQGGKKVRKLGKSKKGVKLVIEELGKSHRFVFSTQVHPTFKILFPSSLLPAAQP